MLPARRLMISSLEIEVPSANPAEADRDAKTMTARRTPNILLSILPYSFRIKLFASRLLWRRGNSHPYWPETVAAFYRVGHITPILVMLQCGLYSFEEHIRKAASYRIVEEVLQTFPVEFIFRHHEPYGLFVYGIRF